MSQLIFKICQKDAWHAAVKAGAFDGAAIDLADGYIHFSTVGQARETARMHFAGQTDLVLVALDPGKLGDKLRWEPARGGDLFPHLYGSLDPGVAEWVMDLPLDANDQHVFPDQFETGNGH